MTEAVLSFMGLAGVVALAIGFAFRDIAENFIASVMLGVRRPFRVGDFLEVAGRSGVVKSLNTRATVVVSLDGSHIRIPNSKIFKEILVNRSASTAMRASFDIRWSLTPRKSRPTLQHDTDPSSIASSQLPEDQENEVGHALSNSDKEIDEEEKT
jgi:hypothetical protein